MSRMKVAFTVLLLACQRLKGNVVRRKDALQEEVYATSENVKKKTANLLNETNASFETITEDSHIERMSGARKNGTESKEHDDGNNHANPNISQLMQHGEIMRRTSILQGKNPEDAHYESEEKFDSRMARDTDDDETGEDIDPDNEDNDDGDKIAFKPADPRVVKPDRVPIFAEIKEDAVKPFDLHIYIHLSGLGRNHVSRKKQETRLFRNNEVYYRDLIRAVVGSGNHGRDGTIFENSARKKNVTINSFLHIVIQNHTF